MYKVDSIFTSFIDFLFLIKLRNNLRQKNYCLWQ
jgi:hypothetical protein